MQNKTVILLFLTLAACVKMQAQFDAQFSQYWALPNYYNAGSAGYSGKLNILAASRTQWVGMPNAPQTFFVSADMPLRLFKQNHGIGLVVTTEPIGLFSNLSFNLQYAYKLKLWDGELGLGIQLGLFDQSFDGSKVFIPETDDHNPSEEGIPKAVIQGTAFDMAFGVYYTRKNLYGGISATHLTQPTISLTDDSKNYETYLGRLYYFTVGGNIPIKNTLYEIQPSLFLKTNLQMVQVEATARVMLRKMFWGGLSYRWKDAIIVMVGANIKNFKIGYSYDWSVSPIIKANSGSHEVFIGYDLKIDMSKKNKNKHKSIRIL